MSEYTCDDGLGAYCDELGLTCENPFPEPVRETTRVVSGRTYKVTHLTCEYVENPQVIAGVSKIRAWAGRTDATMIPADHA